MRKAFVIALVLLSAAIVLSWVPAMSKDSDVVYLSGKYVIGHAILRAPFILVDTTGAGIPACAMKTRVPRPICTAEKKCCEDCDCGTPECKGKCDCCDKCRCCATRKMAGCKGCASKAPGCKGCAPKMAGCKGCKSMMRIVMVGGTILDPWTLNLKKAKYVAVEYKMVSGQRIATRVTQLEHSCKSCNK